jgi:hypothetical protein
MESVIDSVTPNPGHTVRIDVVGGDALIRIRASGTVVEIPGYKDEPYLKIEANGAVFENVNSVTKQINSTRYGSTWEADAVDGDVQWNQMSSDGTAMWHDHRAHWMSPIAPRVIDDKGTIQRFEIPIVVNNVKTIVAGTLYLRSGASLAWWLFALIPFAGALISMRKRRLAMYVCGLSVVIGGVGVVQYFGLPSGVRLAPTLATFAVLAAVLSGISLIWKRHSVYVGALTAGAGIALVLGGWLMRSHVSSYYVPGMNGHDWLIRLSIISMIAIGVVAVVDGVWRSLMPATPQQNS